jgi:glutamate decarboxylase
LPNTTYFLRLGREGYRRIHETSQKVALYVSGHLAKMGPFTLISDGSDLPVFAFTTNEKASFSVFDISDKVRERGWLLPAYTFPKNREDLAVLRCVCKEGFTRDMADLLLRDIRNAVKHFNSLKQHQPRVKGSAFHH